MQISDHRLCIFYFLFFIAHNALFSESYKFSMADNFVDLDPYRCYYGSSHSKNMEKKRRENILDAMVKKEDKNLLKLK